MGNGGKEARGREVFDRSEVRRFRGVEDRRFRKQSTTTTIKQYQASEKCREHEVGGGKEKRREKAAT